MVTFVVVGVLVLAGAAALIWATRVVFTPKEIHVKGRTAFGQVWLCDHCDEVVTKRNFGEHGVNCAKRPVGRGAERSRD